MLLVQLGCERRFNIEFYGANSHFCHSAYVTWSHVPARLSHFCCRTHFVRRDVRVENRRCNQLFPEMEEMLIEKVHRGTFLYATKSPDYRDQHVRANAWEEIGKELSSRDVRIVCPLLNPTATSHVQTLPILSSWPLAGTHVPPDRQYNNRSNEVDAEFPWSTVGVVISVCWQIFPKVFWQSSHCSMSEILFISTSSVLLEIMLIRWAGDIQRDGTWRNWF
jgi:hypothetical protein